MEFMLTRKTLHCTRVVLLEANTAFTFRVVVVPLNLRHVAPTHLPTFIFLQNLFYLVHQIRLGDTDQSPSFAHVPHLINRLKQLDLADVFEIGLKKFEQILKTQLSERYLSTAYDYLFCLVHVGHLGRRGRDRVLFIAWRLLSAAVADGSGGIRFRIGRRRSRYPPIFVVRIVTAHEIIRIVD